jgi:hypothetical protein
VVEKPTTLNEWEYGGLTGIEELSARGQQGNTSRVPMIDPWVPSERRKGGTGQEPSQRYTCKKCMKGEREERGQGRHREKT